MANAGIIPLVVAHDYLAAFWQKVFTQITVHEAVAVRTGATIAVPFRKNSPKLAAELNAFVARNGLGTAFGNVIEKRYLVNTTFAKSATSEAERQKMLDLIQFFKKYSDQYQMDYLLMAAQGYQESRLDPNAKSSVGAIGVMQVMPATGKELAVGDIRVTENNIHAGVKYMRFMIDRYYKDEPMDLLNKGLFAFASYNAGPARVRQLRQEAGKRGLDPNVWFGNVEQIASERIGRETVTYVANIYKYYVAYTLIMEDRAPDRSRRSRRSRSRRSPWVQERPDRPDPARMVTIGYASKPRTSAPERSPRFSPLARDGRATRRGGSPPSRGTPGRRNGRPRTPAGTRSR